IIEPGSRELLDSGTPIVSDIAGEPALKWGEPGNRLRQLTRQVGSGNSQCVGGGPSPRCVFSSAYLGGVALTSHDENGVRGKEGVLRIRMLASSAIQEQHIRQIQKSGADLVGRRRLTQGLHQRRGPA